MSGVHRPRSQRNQGADTRKKRRDSPKRTVLGGNDSTRHYLPQTPELLSQDSWAIEKQFIAGQQSQLHQQLNDDIQKLGDQCLTNITKLDQKEKRLRVALRYSSQPLEDTPISPSTTSPYAHLSVPSPAIYENVPWAWPPSMDQRTLGVMTDDQTLLFNPNSAIIHECAPAVVQPSTSVEPAVRMVEGVEGVEGEDQGYQSDASSSTMSLRDQLEQPLSPYSDLQSTTSTSTSRRGRHSSAIDKGLDPYGKGPAPDSETDDSPTGMYIPVVIHDKTRGLRRRTK